VAGLMAKLVTVAIVLTPLGQGSSVLVDGQDFSGSCVGIDISARVGQLTEITLHLVGHIELLADVSRVEIEKEPN
jgi:hypothetical protein